MAKKSVTVLNPEALTAQLRALDNAVSESTLRQAAVAGARVIQQEVKLRAPIGPYPHVRSGKLYRAGTLQKNILVFHDEEASAGAGVQVYSMFIGKDAFYARMVEYGSSRAPAHPFIRPAFEAKKKAIAQAVNDVIQAKIKEATNVK